MSASSASASTTLTRSRTAILVFTSLAAAYLIYYSQTHPSNESESLGPVSPGQGLQRRNATRRRRARNNESNDEELTRETAVEVREDNDSPETIARPLGDGDTVVEETWQDDDWSNWGTEQPPSQRNGQNIVQLLFRVSEDATRRNAYVHRGCQCNSCGTVPIRGIRYRCSNCADFDLCEACEAQGLHIKTHIFYKVRVPTSSFATRPMQPVWYPGDPDTCLKSLPKELIARLSKETGFDRPELDAYWEQWTFMANTEWREDPDDLCLAMDRKTFDQCLVPSAGNRHPAPNLIHDRMFAFYDTNHDDLISFPEFLNGLAYRKKKDKLKRVFEGFDIDGDGYVDRKDFLRMFRSYYVVYKQMHRDMLEGLDDQVMNGTDAHQLITSRQPLSSAFGRDGRLPAAPNPRTGEGKAPGVDGDLTITDGKGVISDSANDLGNREDVIIDAVVREYPRWQQPDSWLPTSRTAYWRAMINPPETISGLQHDVLEVLIRERRRTAQDTGNVEQYVPNSVEPGTNEMNESNEGEILDRNWPPSFVTLADVEVVGGEGTTFGTLPSESRISVIHQALQRLQELSVNHQTLAVNEEIHERWKRRQFYTDEEEGAVAPPDWKEEEDVPYLNGKVGENSKETAPSSRPISPRSRSSSKVRFAPDTDDLETRSNPSTSSRSVPERWGGIEIPEAEKDAGKEILYQVTQQACNELLDKLFKKQEDIALTALSSKKSRDKYRHLFTNPLFEKWAVVIDKSLKKTKKKRANAPTETMKEIQRELDIPEVELAEVRQWPLEDLLAVAGYTVQPEAVSSVDSVQNVDANTGSDTAAVVQPTPELGESVSLDVSEPQPSGLSDLPPSLDTREHLPQSSLNNHGIINEDEVGVVQEAAVAPTNSVEPSALTQSRIEAIDPPFASESETSYRDPTFPQFLPNSIPLPYSVSGDSVTLPQRNMTPAGAYPNQRSSVNTPLLEESDSLHNGGDVHNRGETVTNLQPSEVVVVLKKPDDDSTAGVQASHLGKRAGKPLLAEFDKSQFMVEKRRAIEEMPEESRKEFVEVDWKMLYELRHMEALAKQEEAKGGWGRLSWEEFEQLIKGENSAPLTETSRRAMMDFLGSWIEFCIP